MRWTEFGSGWKKLHGEEERYFVFCKGCKRAIREEKAPEQGQDEASCCHRCWSWTKFRPQLEDIEFVEQLLERNQKELPRLRSAKTAHDQWLAEQKKLLKSLWIELTRDIGR